MSLHELIRSFQKQIMLVNRKILTLLCTSQAKHFIIAIHSENILCYVNMVSLFMSVYITTPKLTPWCQRDGTSQMTDMPCSCIQRQKVARWHVCGTWSVRWRQPGSHRWLLLERHPTPPPGRREHQGNFPSVSLCQHLHTRQKGGTAPRWRRRKGKLFKKPGKIFKIWKKAKVDKYELIIN